MKLKLDRDNIPEGCMKLEFPEAKGSLPVVDISRLLVGLGRLNLIYRIGNEEELDKHKRLLTSRSFYYLNTLAREDFSKKFQVRSLHYGSPLSIILGAGAGVAGLAGFTYTCLAIGDKLRDRGAIDGHAYEALLADLVGIFLTNVNADMAPECLRLLKSVVHEFRALRVDGLPRITISNREKPTDRELSQLKINLPDWLD